MAGIALLLVHLLPLTAMSFPPLHRGSVLDAFGENGEYDSTRRRAYITQGHEAWRAKEAQEGRGVHSGMKLFSAPVDRQHATGISLQATDLTTGNNLDVARTLMYQQGLFAAAGGEIRPTAAMLQVVDAEE